MAAVLDWQTVSEVDFSCAKAVTRTTKLSGRSLKTTYWRTRKRRVVDLYVKLRTLERIWPMRFFFFIRWARFYIISFNSAVVLVVNVVDVYVVVVGDDDGVVKVVVNDTCESLVSVCFCFVLFVLFLCRLGV